MIKSVFFFILMVCLSHLFAYVFKESPRIVLFYEKFNNNRIIVRATPDAKEFRVAL